MQIHDGQMSLKEIEDIDKQLNEVEFKSGLRCFMSHSGIRRAELSTIIGPYGNGKSTFVRSMITELLASGKRILLVLSEEKVKFYKRPLWKIVYSSTQSEDKTNEIMKNLSMIAELEMEEEETTVDVFIRTLGQVIPSRGIDTVIIDNYTTSFLGNLPIWNQQTISIALKKFAVKFNLPIFAVFHTTKGVDIYNKIITGEDVRGSAATANIGSYNYVVMTYFRAKPRPKAFVIVDKARYHKNSNKTAYELNYDADLEIYTGDRKIDFEEIQGVVNSLKQLFKKVRT